MGRSGKTDKIRLFNTYYSEDIAEYKRFAENRSRATRYNQEYLTELTCRIKDYLSEQILTHRPFTVTGLYMCLDMQKKDYYKAKRGEFDWKLYMFMDHKGISFEDLEEYQDEMLGVMQTWTDEDGQFFIMETYSSIIEKSLLVIQSQLEEALYINRNPAGAIFLLKSRFGWSDKPDQVQQVKAIPHIATYEEAKQVLKELDLR